MDTRILRPGKPLSENDLLSAAEILRRGGLIAFPTETVYGLGADALNERACADIYKAKGRPSDNPLIVHIAEPSDAEKYAVVPELYYRLAEAFMPGPLTVIMKKRPVIPDRVTGGLDTVAVRCPSNAIAHALIRLSGVPVAAPSANISGKPSTTAFAHVYADLFGKVDMIIDGGECDIGLESTIVKIVGDGITLLRPGAVTVEQLSLFGDVTVDPAVTTRTESSAPPLAPGMKYRHYAPRARLTAIETDNAERAYEYIKAHADKNAAVLCCEEDVGCFPGFCIYKLGSRSDEMSQAKRLFSALRETDGEEHSHLFAVTPPLGGGVGTALHNRLMKAAGYDVLRLCGTVKIGVTGASGSGKSTFAALLAEKLGNAIVIDCDAINRDMLENDGKYQKTLVSAFGDGILTDGKPDRRKLGALVFSDAEKLKTLNSLAHPRIVARVSEAAADAERQGKEYVVIDAPLLYDTPLAGICDVRITVKADDARRSERLSLRDGKLPYLRQRTAAQERDFSASDITIDNSKALADLESSAEATAQAVKKK